MKAKSTFFRGLKNRKLKNSHFPHFAYYWKMKFYCKWSIFSYSVTYYYNTTSVHIPQ